MDKINYYSVPPDKIGLVLLFMNSYGWKFDQVGTSGLSIEKGHIQATSRDWDGHQCVFKLEQWKDYKFVSITSDLLMKANKQDYKIHSYNEFKNKIGL